MPDRHIIAIGAELPLAQGIIEYEPYYSLRSLGDADVIIFTPAPVVFGSRTTNGLGELLIEGSTADLFYQHTTHWFREISQALDRGINVFVFLPRRVEMRLATNGNSRQTELVHNYEALPVDIGEITASEGRRMTLTGRLPGLAPYWQEFGEHSRYEMYLDWPDWTPLIRNRGGNHVVGAMRSKANGGTIIALPPLWIDTDPRALGFSETMQRLERLGQRFVALLVALDGALRAEATITPPPAWSQDASYRTDSEAALLIEHAEVAARFAAIEQEMAALDARLERERRLRDLLYETGKPLERAIVSALHVLGFEAENYQDEDSEFDAVFTSEEGRCLGEAEGKDNKAIAVDKLSQLLRNISEDLHREDVEYPAKGVLFGNAFRLQPLEERDEQFTDKCIRSARQSRISLVRTPDLFRVVRYLSGKDDAVYARACRLALMGDEGGIVTFPDTPTAAEESAATRMCLMNHHSV